MIWAPRTPFLKLWNQQPQFSRPSNQDRDGHARVAPFPAQFVQGHQQALPRAGPKVPDAEQSHRANSNPQETRLLDHGRRHRLLYYSYFILFRLDLNPIRFVLTVQFLSCNTALHTWIYSTFQSSSFQAFFFLKVKKEWTLECVFEIFHSWNSSVPVELYHYLLA